MVMRICYFGDAQSMHLKRWVAYFLARGAEIHVISVRDGEIEGATVHDIGLVEFTRRPKRLLPKALGTLRMIFRIRWLVYRIRPDLLHIHFLYTHPALLAFKGIRNLVVSTWGSDVAPPNGPEARRNWFYKASILRDARVITASSKFLARAAARYIPRRKDVEVNPFGVDLTLFRPSRRKARNGVRIVSTKVLNPVYGHRFLVRAFHRVVKSVTGASLHLIGHGSEEKSIKEAIEKLGLSQHVRFLPWLSPPRVRDELREADLFVLCSLRESMPISLLEAMAMGVPVVATRVGGVPEVVRDGETGLLVEPGDVEALGKAMLKMVRDGRLRESMGRRAREVVVGGYDWAYWARRMGQRYEHILGASR